LENVAANADDVVCWKNGSPLEIVPFNLAVLGKESNYGAILLVESTWRVRAHDRVESPSQEHVSQRFTRLHELGEWRQRPLRTWRWSAFNRTNEPLDLVDGNPRFSDGGPAPG